MTEIETIDWLIENDTDAGLFDTIKDADRLISDIVNPISVKSASQWDYARNAAKAELARRAIT